MGIARFKKLWSISQEENWKKQKEANKKRKLEQLQKPTEVQLDKRIEDKVNAKIDSTVPNELRTILARSLKHQSFIQRDASKKASATKTNSNETQKTGMVGDSGKKRKKRKQKKNKKTVSPADTTSMAVNVATDLLENIPEERQSVNTAIITQ